MLADIVHGKTGAADLFFLIACIVFAIGLVIVVVVKPLVLDRLCLFAGLFCVALALLLL